MFPERSQGSVTPIGMGFYYTDTQPSHASFCHHPLLCPVRRHRDLVHFMSRLKTHRPRPFCYLVSRHTDPVLSILCLQIHRSLSFCYLCVDTWMWSFLCSDCKYIDLVISMSCLQTECLQMYRSHPSYVLSANI